MNKIIGTILIIIGLILIGLGTYQEFQNFENTFVSETKSNYLDGLYITSGDSITVTTQNDSTIDVIINNADYEFTYNGNYYENKKSGFYIIFNDKELTLYRNGEKIRTLYKK